MNIEVKIPASPVTSIKLVIAELYVEEGDYVELDNNLFDVESDKLILEVVAPSHGIVEKISIDKGDIVSESQVVMLLKECDKRELTTEQSGIKTIQSKQRDPLSERLALEEVIGNSPFNKSALICGLLGLIVGSVLGSFLTIVYLG
jgi:2-oxoglutarate dehydrogenase E2 component (dihydrolipoamide succinyltransferase)